MVLTNTSHLPCARCSTVLYIILFTHFTDEDTEAQEDPPVVRGGARRCSQRFFRLSQLTGNNSNTFLEDIVVIHSLQWSTSIWK